VEIREGPEEEMEPPTKDEVWEIIMLQTGKSPGIDNTSAELKYGDNKLWNKILAPIENGHQKKCQKTGELQLYASNIRQEINSNVTIIERSPY
jgi:hypothetical protein